MLELCFLLIICKITLRYPGSYFCNFYFVVRMGFPITKMFQQGKRYIWQLKCLALMASFGFIAWWIFLFCFICIVTVSRGASGYKTINNIWIVMMPFWAAECKILLNFCPYGWFVLFSIKSHSVILISCRHL